MFQRIETDNADKKTSSVDSFAPTGRWPLSKLPKALSYKEHRPILVRVIVKMTNKMHYSFII